MNLKRCFMFKHFPHTGDVVMDETISIIIGTPVDIFEPNDYAQPQNTNEPQIIVFDPIRNLAGIKKKQEKQRRNF